MGLPSFAFCLALMIPGHKISYLLVDQVICCRVDWWWRFLCSLYHKAGALITRCGYYGLKSNNNPPWPGCLFIPIRNMVLSYSFWWVCHAWVRPLVCHSVSLGFHQFLFKWKFLQWVMFFESYCLPSPSIRFYSCERWPEVSNDE